MNKKLKKQLEAAFRAPAPTRKTEFLRSVNFPKSNRFDFIVGQIGYIRKRVWLTSCLLAAAALTGLRFWTGGDSSDLIWIISSVLPYVSLVTVAELSRSTSYSMDELEISCRFNLADIVLARLGILSFFNTAVFSLIVLAFISKFSIDVFRLGLYLFLPFLLTCSLSFFTLNRLRSREATYICGGISCFVGLTNASVFNQYHIVLSDRHLPFLYTAFIALIIFAIKETIGLYRGAKRDLIFAMNIGCP